MNRMKIELEFSKVSEVPPPLGELLQIIFDEQPFHVAAGVANEIIGEDKLHWAGIDGVSWYARVTHWARLPER